MSRRNQGFGATEVKRDPAPRLRAELNVTPLVDIIFCLCLFFLCSFHFKQLEGKMDSWLPKDGQNPGVPSHVVELEDIRISMAWDAAAGSVVRQVNRSPALTDEDLRSLVSRRRANFLALGQRTPPVSIDAAPDVPWKEVVATLNLCRLEQIDRIEFAAPRSDN